MEVVSLKDLVEIIWNIFELEPEETKSRIQYEILVKSFDTLLNKLLGNGTANNIIDQELANEILIVIFESFERFRLNCC
jgi:hypothetical protein